MSDVNEEVRALRDAVDDLANRVGAAPGLLPADRMWRGAREDGPLAEWDVQYQEGGRGLRHLAVRAGWPDDIPGLFLVDYIGDMHALSVREAHRLIAALTAGISHVNDDLARRRTREAS